LNPINNFFLAFLLLISAYLVFRVIVRRDYQTRGTLRWISSAYQLLVFFAFFCFPYSFNPPEWGEFWRISTAESPVLYTTGLILIILGIVFAFGTMAWFGIGQAFGVLNTGLRKTGPYRISRNPQIVGGSLLVIGPVLQWPSLSMVGWMGMFALIMHWMVLTEEEHLKKVFGEEYESYCQEVPRYFRLPWKQG
jgi:protein-S-isoprenylcysteine O-methyltransferase Ste14